MKLTPQDAERFWSKVDKSAGPDSCWEWQGTLVGAEPSYGSFYFGGGKQRAHRVAHTLANGPIPEGMWVLHHCDNPPCCNPAHLFLGTDADNLRDSFAKGRQPTRVIGGRHGLARLTEADVRQIRKLYAAGGVSHRELARRFGVGATTVARVINGTTWTHVR